MERSLLSAGFLLPDPSVALVETASPLRRYRAVLLQNAWNVVPREEFKRLLGPYPLTMQARIHLRRTLAHHNLARAETVVCLTDSTAKLFQRATGHSAVVSPITVPLMPPVSSKQRTAPFVEGLAVVPGTVTWYKRPIEAVSWCAENAPQIERLVFCGVDDGSGCWQAVERRAQDLKISVQKRLLDHPAMMRLIGDAEVTLLPSALESLGFALGESLLHSRRTVASPIPAHIEVAHRLGLTAEWAFDPHMDPAPTELTQCAYAQDGNLSDWLQLGQILTLQNRSTPNDHSKAL